MGTDDKKRGNMPELPGGACVRKDGQRDVLPEAGFKIHQARMADAEAVEKLESDHKYSVYPEHINTDSSQVFTAKNTEKHLLEISEE